MVLRPLLHSLLYFPARELLQTPAHAGLEFTDAWIDTDDSERLHGWWIPAPTRSLAHLLLLHGNAGNVGDRVLHAALLCSRGLDVMLVDYRGYGRSSGRPSEEGTYRDARAARDVLMKQEGVDPRRVVYLGESLGGAVALKLAVEHPPAGLVLQSTFTSVRDMARRHYPFIPPAAVPDAYPSLRLISDLRSAVLVLHGERDDIVPAEHGRALFDAAPEPKQLCVIAGAGHNDLLAVAGERYANAIDDWARDTLGRS